jgi:isopenicillin-N N-acyltransferase like protein
MPQTDLITLTGSPREMGQQHGRLLKDEIHFLARERYELAIEHAAKHNIVVRRDVCLRMAKQHLGFHHKFSSEVYEELSGIADGAEISLEELFIANALTDFRDALWQNAPTPPGAPGCTSFGIHSSRAAGQPTLLGQTWDMHATAQQVVHVFLRRPNNAPDSLTVSTAGCLSLIGVNDAGIAIGNNNLEPRDARSGVMYLAMIHEALRQKTFPAACKAITRVHRSSGHNYVLASAGGELANIETTAERVVETHSSAPFFVHTNHYLAPELRSLEVPGARASSEHRLKRMTTLLEQHKGVLDAEQLRRIMSDHDGGPELCICREGGSRDSRSCAFAVMAPATREMWVTIGPPNSGTLTRYSLS